VTSAPGTSTGSTVLPLTARTGQPRRGREDRPARGHLRPERRWRNCAAIPRTTLQPRYHGDNAEAEAPGHEKCYHATDEGIHPCGTSGGRSSAADRSPLDPGWRYGAFIDLTPNGRRRTRTYPSVAVRVAGAALRPRFRSCPLRRLTTEKVSGPVARTRSGDRTVWSSGMALGGESSGTFE